MRRRLNPWVVLLSAALTFGSLMAFVGPRSFDHFRDYRYGPRFYGHHNDHRRYGPCDDADRVDSRLNDPRAGQKSAGSDTSSSQ